MRSDTKHAGQAQLQTLIFGDESSEQYQQALAHVEECASCRRRLDTLAAPASFDNETRELLCGAGEHLSGWTGDQPIESDKTDDSRSDDIDAYLDPPNHPEMLGRLGRYEIERAIGNGGMGVVFKAFDTELNRPVAIKILARHLAHSGAARQRFSREAKAAAAVVNEHVAAIHNVETNGEFPFLVMQFVAGESLQTRVDREGPLESKELLRIGSQAAAGLQAAHEQGVVHRDIKPGNILLEEDVERALVTDFGLAQTVDDASLTQTGVVAGTPNYMSPEQAVGSATDHRSDLFSLGSVLYFMATGHAPFRAERAMGVLNRICHSAHTPAWQVNPEIPNRVSDIIDRLLQKNPKRRFASAAQAEKELRGALAELQHRRPRRADYLRRFTRRHQAKLWIGAALTLLGLSAAWGRLIFNQFANPDPQSPDQVVEETQVTHEPQFELSVFQQASSTEAEAWDASISDINDALDHLESPTDGAASPSDWDEGTDTLRRQILELQGKILAP